MAAAFATCIAFLLFCSRHSPQEAVQVGEKKALRAISGKVQGLTDGKPVANAKVILRWRVHPELPGLVGHTLGNHGLAEVETTTDDRGRFRFKPPHLGPFMLIAMLGEQSSPQDFPVMAGARRILRLEATTWIGGTVSDQNGKAIAGAKVELMPDTETWSRLALYRLPERRAADKTDETGQFRLLFEHAYLRNERWGAFSFPWCTALSFSNQSILRRRPDASARKLRLGLAPAKYLRGKITDGQSGNAISAAVFYDPLSRRSVLSDAEGKYSLALPCAAVWVRKPGFALVEVQSTTSAIKDLAVSVSLQKGLHLSATVLTPDKAPLANARVLCAILRNGSFPMEWTTKTADDGSFKTTMIPAGKPVLAYVEHNGVFVRFHDTALAQDSKLGTLTLDRARSLRGTVHAVDGERVAGIRVALMPKSRTNERDYRITYTDRSGRFAFENVADEDFYVIASGGKHGQSRIEVAAALLEQAVVIQMNEGKSITGQILDPDGKPVQGAWVNINKGRSHLELPSPSINMTSFCVLSDKDGRFRFQGLPTSASWSLSSKYLRHGIYWRGTATATPGAKLVIKMAIATDR